MFNTGLQVGNSIGIALIGVIFFGLLGSQSAARGQRRHPAAARRAGRGRACPPVTPGPIVTQFRSCLHDRLVAADPTVTPAACRPSGAAAALPPAAHRRWPRAGGTAVRHDFAAALQRTLWFQVGVFGLAFLLMLLLPARRGRQAGPR